MIDSRRKGADAERELVRILRAAGWPLACRTSDGRVQAARGDIANGPEGTHIEAKSGNLKLTAALDQVARDAISLDMPLLAYKPARHAWLGVVYLEDLLPLLKLRES